MSPYRILCISNDQALLNSRTAVLRRAGYRVTSTMDHSAALELLAGDRRQFHAVIIGHSVPRAHRDEVAAAARRSHVAVLVTCAQDEGRATPADAYVEALSGPQTLLSSLASLLNWRLSAKDADGTAA
ncbi:MAG: hypothetical protein ACE14L_15065 [Terriglobales bacterium]